MSQPASTASTAPGGATKPSRTMVVTFLGAVVLRLGDWLPIGGTVDLMTEAGLDAQSVRTAVFRLKRRNWLTPQTRNGTRGYSLTDVSLAELAAGDKIIWHARTPADLADGWCIVSFSVPENDRGLRHQLRSNLSAMGFGNIGAGMWIAPARMRGSAQRVVDSLDLSARCAIFVGEHVGGQDLGEIVAGSWDLEGIDRRYREFIEDFQPLADQVGHAADRLAPEDAFLSYLRVVDRWRKLPYRDPGLPVETLPAEWPAPQALELFEELVAELQPRALAHAGRHWPDGER